mmetsp:Transcript_3012/g.9228  ORF Transcript_3012/g.9228 Transcript_3012/m.9228 type:complete len:237 (+) Transcript_3012:509-1219(+)
MWPGGVLSFECLHGAEQCIHSRLHALPGLASRGTLPRRKARPSPRLKHRLEVLHLSRCHTADDGSQPRAVCRIPDCKHRPVRVAEVERPTHEKPECLVTLRQVDVRPVPQHRERLKEHRRSPQVRPDCPVERHLRCGAKARKRLVQCVDGSLAVRAFQPLDSTGRAAAHSFLDGLSSALPRPRPLQHRQHYGCLFVCFLRRHSPLAAACVKDRRQSPGLSSPSCAPPLAPALTSID